YVTYKPKWEEYQVPVRWCTCRPVYEHHVMDCPYTCFKPVYHEHKVLVKWTTCRPEYQHHVKDRCYVVYHSHIEETKVPVKYCTFKPEYTTHECLVPCTTYRVEHLPCEKVVRTVTCEPVVTEH